MIRFYSPIFILQLFCLYHCYSNRAEQKWYWLVIFFPFFGSLIYLYHAFYSRRNLDQLTEGVQQVFNSNYKIDRLERELAFSDTVRNKTLLGDEHVAAGNYERAIELYKSSLNGIYQNDPAVLRKLVRVCYLHEDYAASIEYGEHLEGKSTFRNATERIALAWSYYYTGRHDEAERIFRDMDARFTNYEHRLGYARFLDLLRRDEQSRNLLEELLDELESMNRQERRFKRGIHREIRQYYRQSAGIS